MLQYFNEENIRINTDVDGFISDFMCRSPMDENLLIVIKNFSQILTIYLSDPNRKSYQIKRIFRVSRDYTNKLVHCPYLTAEEMEIKKLLNHQTTKATHLANGNAQIKYKFCNTQ